MHITKAVQGQVCAMMCAVMLLFAVTCVWGKPQIVPKPSFQEVSTARSERYLMLTSLIVALDSTRSFLVEYLPVLDSPATKQQYYGTFMPEFVYLTEQQSKAFAQFQDIITKIAARDTTAAITKRAQLYRFAKDVAIIRCVYLAVSREFLHTDRKKTSCKTVLNASSVQLALYQKLMNSNEWRRFVSSSDREKLQKEVDLLSKIVTYHSTSAIRP